MSSGVRKEELQETQHLYSVVLSVNGSPHPQPEEGKLGNLEPDSPGVGGNGLLFPPPTPGGFPCEDDVAHTTLASWKAKSNI